MKEDNQTEMTKESTNEAIVISKGKTQKTLGEILISQKKQIESALPKHLTADRMLRIIMTEIRTNPKLKECSIPSVIGSVIQASQLGLEPGGILGKSYLIPYKSKDGMECQFIVGYRGMIELARRSGQVVSIRVREVHENDKFEYSYGMNEKCEHVQAEGDRGEFKGVYAIIEMRDGGKQFEYMTAAEINKIRDCTSSYSYWVRSGMKGTPPIWEKHYVEMAKKTVIRRIFKYLPISIEIQSAIGLDEASDRGDQRNSFIIDGETIDEDTGEIKQTKSNEIANKIMMS